MQTPFVNLTISLSLYPTGEQYKASDSDLTAEIERG